MGPGLESVGEPPSQVFSARKILQCARLRRGCRKQRRVAQYPPSLATVEGLAYGQRVHRQGRDLHRQVPGREQEPHQK